MAILNFQIGTAGQTAVEPRIINIDTNNTEAEILATGFLNDLVNKQNFSLSEKDMALVSTKLTPNATASSVAFYEVVKSGNNWSLVADASSFRGQLTTAGGAAAEAFTITGVAATDLIFTQMVDDGTSNVTILQAAATANTMTVTFSADPGTDTIFNYQIIRP